MCNDIKLKHSSHIKVLGVTVDNELSVDEPTNGIGKTANGIGKTLNAVSRINH